MRFTLPLIAILAALPLSAVDWPQFRGPNGSGVAETTGLPVEFGPEQNVAWKVELPAGYSSPVLTDKHIFVTAYSETELWTICLDRSSGEEVWRKQAPKALARKSKGPNSPVSPSPVTDGKNIYAFFEAFGLVSYSPTGEERWRMALGPFNTPYGLGASPVVADDTLLLLCDQDTGSFLLAVDKETGKERWRKPRPSSTHGFASPVIYQPKEGGKQAVVSGSFQLVAYSLADGEAVWWVDGLAWQAKSLPVIAADGTIYVHSWMASPAELGFPSKVPPYKEMLAENDKDDDGKLSKEETPDEEVRKFWFLFDLDKDGYLTELDWEAFARRSTAKNGLFAIRPEGEGDITATAVSWTHTKSLPNIPSPLLYNGVLYVLKEGGILTALDPGTGKVLKQGRVEGALDAYFASPVAGDGKVYTASKDGKVAVLEAGPKWKVLQVNEFEEEIWATPAIADGHIYVRTQEALYAF
jgi:outer membrane protein assembly factor BamB